MEQGQDIWIPPSSILLIHYSISISSTTIYFRDFTSQMKKLNENLQFIKLRIFELKSRSKYLL